MILIDGLRDRLSPWIAGAVGGAQHDENILTVTGRWPTATTAKPTEQGSGDPLGVFLGVSLFPETPKPLFHAGLRA